MAAIEPALLDRIAVFGGLSRQTVDRLAGRTPYRPTLEDRRRVILSHFEALMEQEDPKHALHKLRTFT